MSVAWSCLHLTRRETINYDYGALLHSSFVFGMRCRWINVFKPENAGLPFLSEKVLIKGLLLVWCFIRQATLTFESGFITGIMIWGQNIYLLINGIWECTRINCKGLNCLFFCRDPLFLLFTDIDTVLLCHYTTTLDKWSNRAFPKWISLNSANYYYPSVNRYINRASNTKCIFHYYLWVGIYCQSPLRTDTNLQVVVENSFFTTTSRNVTITPCLFTV